MGTKVSGLRTTSHFDERLSPGETLLIWRRRMGWTQIMAANSFGVSIFKQKLAEYDAPSAVDFPYKRLKFKLTAYEKCLLYRKRAKRTQSSVAQALGVSRNWLRMMETGEVDASPLLKYWNGTG